MLIIRQETENDRAKVYQLVKQAFETAEHSDGTEHDLVNRLRLSESFVPELSLVAEWEGRIAGYILFTKIKLGDYPALALAPLAVTPAYQGKGVGTALIREGHAIAGKLGFAYSVVLGSETYYPRCGYRPAADFDIRAPFDVPDENYMAIDLRGGQASKVNAEVGYAKEFFE